MEKFIFNTDTLKRIVLDNNNKVIDNLFIINDTITNIDFNNLPSNIFDNIRLFLGNDYICFYIDLKEIQERYYNMKYDDDHWYDEKNHTGFFCTEGIVTIESISYHLSGENYINTLYENLIKKYYKL